MEVSAWVNEKKRKKCLSSTRFVMNDPAHLSTFVTAKDKDESAQVNTTQINAFRRCSYHYRCRLHCSNNQVVARGASLPKWQYSEVVGCKRKSCFHHLHVFSSQLRTQSLGSTLPSSNLQAHDSVNNQHALIEVHTVPNGQVTFSTKQCKAKIPLKGLTTVSVGVGSGLCPTGTAREWRVTVQLVLIWSV